MSDDYTVRLSALNEIPSETRKAAVALGTVGQKAQSVGHATKAAAQEGCAALGGLKGSAEESGRAFKNAGGSAQRMGRKIQSGSSFGKMAFTKMLSKISVVTMALGTIKDVAVKAFEFGREGAINKDLRESIESTFGQDSVAIVNKFKEAVNFTRTGAQVMEFGAKLGMFGFDLQESADVMKLAKVMSKQLGGGIEEAESKICEAVESGSVRTLSKLLGETADNAEREARKFAEVTGETDRVAIGKKALEVITRELTEQGLLSDEAIRSQTDSYNQLDSELQNLNSDVSVLTDEVIESSGIIDGATSVVGEMREVLKGTSNACKDLYNGIKYSNIGRMIRKEFKDASVYVKSMSSSMLDLIPIISLTIKQIDVLKNHKGDDGEWSPDMDLSEIYEWVDKQRAAMERKNSHWYQRPQEQDDGTSKMMQRSDAKYTEDERKGKSKSGSRRSNGGGEEDAWYSGLSEAHRKQIELQYELDKERAKLQANADREHKALVDRKMDREINAMFAIMEAEARMSDEMSRRSDVETSESIREAKKASKKKLDIAESAGAESTRIVDSMNSALGSALSNLTTGVATELGMLFGEMAMGMEFDSENFLAMFLKMIGQFMLTFGGAMISLGVAVLTMKNAMQSMNGWAILAAGAALTVAGGFVMGIANSLGSRAASVDSGEKGDRKAQSNREPVMTPMRPNEQPQGQTVINMNFNGVVGDAKGAAREIVGLINGNAGRSAPLIAARATA